jgi:hypothetical protein
VTDEENKAVEQYGITQQTNTTFHFAGYRYRRLEDAINYAKNHQYLLNAENANSKSKS